jgi:uncharacterized membrane protein YgcG
MADINGCSSFGDLAPGINIDKVERLSAQAKSSEPGKGKKKKQVTPPRQAPQEEEIVKVRLSFNQLVRDASQKFWFEEEQSLQATNIRIIATTNPAMTKRMLYLKERVRRFKISRGDNTQMSLTDLFAMQGADTVSYRGNMGGDREIAVQPVEITQLFNMMFANRPPPVESQGDDQGNINPIEVPLGTAIISEASPLGDVQIIDMGASEVIDNVDRGVEVFQDGTEIRKKFSFDVEFKYFKRSNQSPEIRPGRVGVGKSIGNANDEGHLSIFAFCYLNLRVFSSLAPRGMTDFDPITTGAVNFANVIGTYDSQYFDDNLQRSFDIDFPGSRPISVNGDFLARTEAFEGVAARPEDIFYLDPRDIRARGREFADRQARTRAVDQSIVLGRDYGVRGGQGAHKHVNSEGVVSYMPFRTMQQYREVILSSYTEPSQVFGPGRQLLRDKRQLQNIKKSPFSAPLENSLERLFSELTDGIGSFGEKQVNKLFNTENNYFSSLWATKDHQEDVRLMFAFDLTKFIEDNSLLYHMLQRQSFRQIIDRLTVPLYDIKDMRVSRKKVRLRPGAANSLGSGYADDPVDEYNVEEYIGSAIPATVNPKSVAEQHTDKMLRFFYLKDDMSQEIEAQTAGHFQYTAEATVVDNSALVIKTMLSAISKDSIDIQADRAAIDYGGTLFDANGVIDQEVRERLFGRTFAKINVLANFLDALIPPRNQFDSQLLKDAQRKGVPTSIFGAGAGSLKSLQGDRDFDDYVGSAGTYRLMLADLAAESYSGTVQSSLESLDALVDIYQATQQALIALVKRVAPNFTFTGDSGSGSTVRNNDVQRGVSEGGNQKIRPLKARKQFEETVRIGKYYKCGYEYILPRDTTSPNYRDVYNSSRLQPVGFNGNQFRTMNPVTYGKRTGFEKLKFYRGDASDDNLLTQAVTGIVGSYLTPMSIRAHGGGFAGDESNKIFLQGINTRNLYGVYKKLLVDLLELQFGNEQSDYYYLRNTAETNVPDQREIDANRTASLVTTLSAGGFPFVFTKAFSEDNRTSTGKQGSSDDLFGVSERLNEGDDNYKRAKKTKDEFNDIDDEERSESSNRQRRVDEEDRNVKPQFATISDRTLFSLFKQFIMSDESTSLANEKFDSIAKVSKRFAERRRIDEAFEEDDMREVNRELNRLPLSLRAMVEMSLGITQNNVRLPLYNVDKDKADRLRNQDRFNSLFVEIPDRDQPLSVYDPMKDPVKFPAFWLNHKQLVKVEYLAGFYSGENEQYSIKSEAWRPLPLEVLFGNRNNLSRFVQIFNTTADTLEALNQSEQTQETIASDEAQRQLSISEQDYFICRLVPYETQVGKSMGVRKIDTFDLPIYDRYFILHHGFNYIDQFVGVVEGRDPERIELEQPIPPEQEELQEQQQGNVFQGYSANEEENQNTVASEMRSATQDTRQNTPANQQTQQASDFLEELDAKAGQAPPKQTKYESKSKETTTTPGEKPPPKEDKSPPPKGGKKPPPKGGKKPPPPKGGGSFPGGKGGGGQQGGGSFGGGSFGGGGGIGKGGY